MKQIKFYGMGGQGVVTAAKILSIAVSMHEDKYAITIPAYGAERRGAPVYTDIIIDDKPIQVNCFVYDPDIVIVMDETIIEKGIDVSVGKHEETILLLNSGDKNVAEKYKQLYNFKEIYWGDATRIAFENIGVGIPNGSILGALARTGLVSITAIERALVEYFGEKAGVKNAKAARAAYEEIKKM